MSNDVSASCDPVDPPARVAWLRNGVQVMVFSGIVALVIGLLQQSTAAMAENLLYSECIGLSIFGVYVAIRVVFGRRRMRTASDFLVRAVIAIPIGFLVGVNLAAWLHGDRYYGLAMFVRSAPFAIVTTVVTSAIAMFYFWSRNRIADAAAAEALAQRTAVEARLKLLETQIEPHMLFNTLANLRALVDVDPARAQAMIDQLIVYLRGTLAASRTRTTTLDAEFTQLRAYLELMSVRMATRLRYVLDLPEALRDAPVAPMLLQPLVENAIKHGLEPRIEGGTIRVTASSSADTLSVEVTDDGVGLVDPSASSGYGVAHVRERLAALYGVAGRFALEPAPGRGVRAVVEWPR